jgi:hypothetical protein
MIMLLCNVVHPRKQRQHRPTLGNKREAGMKAQPGQQGSGEETNTGYVGMSTAVNI